MANVLYVGVEFNCVNTTEYAYPHVHPEAVCVYTNSEADTFENVQAVQSLLGLGQVLWKLGVQQPHGERHHGACGEGEGRQVGSRERICETRGNKKQGGMRT